MLVVMIGIRKSLDCVFTRRELKILDDVMPEMTRRAAADDMKDLEGGSGEVGIFQRLRIFCLGTAASHAHPSRRISNRSSCGDKLEMTKDNPEMRVTFKVNREAPSSDVESAPAPAPKPIHPIHSRIPNNTPNDDFTDSHLPLLIAP